MRWKMLIGIGAAAGAIALAGCDSGTGDAASAPGPGNAPGTVSVRPVDNVGTTLVNSDGNTLYFADQENNGSIRCLDACTRFWMPLAVPAGAELTAGAGVSGTLATVTRPDGTVQATYDGKPLYTFAEDSGPGHAEGNGLTDTFDGTEFLWHAAVVSGSAATTTGTSGTNDYGY